eukprot:TRINITY_DN3323_c1_g2_i1.p1 TRINITY_DN3323_c1_g2~~TRINITY_DN3323_c1_g2_i1.p1  ORF type:complete len:112 (-),score=1.11 TRINITY_DN3323_c1_g2_i1:167-502(-)
MPRTGCTNNNKGEGGEEGTAGGQAGSIAVYLDGDRALVTVALNRDRGRQPPRRRRQQQQQKQRHHNPVPTKTFNSATVPWHTALFTKLNHLRAPLASFDSIQEHQCEPGKD